VWQSRQISLDGVESLRQLGDIVTGQAWSPADDKWYDFRFDLRSRTIEGGAYAS